MGEERLDQKQERQDCQQEAICSGQEGLRTHQGLDSCRPEGPEGLGCQGLRCSEERNCSLQEGQGALPVSICKRLKAQLRVWGCLRPSSAVALDTSNVYF